MGIRFRLGDLLAFFVLMSWVEAAIGFPKRFGPDEQTNVVVADKGAAIWSS
jgi:hypothetical protein